MHADTPTACENCACALQGPFCHACGQRAINPLRHFAHAVEEVFESFWHLDGRVFRTLRDLFVPGRVACNYLAGQRVRYIAPLRLFVILTVLTFFVGQVAVSVTASAAPVDATDDSKPSDDDGSASAIQNAKTEAEVQAALDAQLAQLREARERTRFVPGVSVAMDQAEAEVRKVAASRVAALRAAAPAAGNSRAAPAVAEPSRVAAATSAAPKRPAAAVAPADATERTARESAKPSGGQNEGPREMLVEMAPAIGRLRDPKRDWDEQANPVDVNWLPAFADRWVNHRMGNIERNGERMNREGGGSLIAEMAMAAVPSALLVLVPVFALLLRLVYPFSGRGYLEHLVVALYSHAFMLLVVFATFLLMLLRAAAPQLATPANLLQTGMSIALPVYLFVMQHRVYRQHWAATAGKYLVVGMAYMFMVLAVVVYSVVAGLTSGN